MEGSGLRWENDSRGLAEAGSPERAELAQRGEGLALQRNWRTECCPQAPGLKEDSSCEALLSSRLVGRQEQGVGGMAVWLQKATQAGELVCVWVTDGLLWACACPLGGIQVAGRATGLEAWDGDVSPVRGWGTRGGGGLGLGHPADLRPSSPLTLQTRAAGQRLSQNFSFVSDPKSQQAANGLPPQTRTPWVAARLSAPPWTWTPALWTSRRGQS